MLHIGAAHLNICRKINDAYHQGAAHRNTITTILRCAAPYGTLSGIFYKYLGALHPSVKSELNLINLIFNQLKTTSQWD
jgi:hypothetical protein